MNFSERKLFQVLLDWFRQCDSRSTFGLVEEILFNWGLEAARRELPQATDGQSEGHSRTRAVNCAQAVMESIVNHGINNSRERIKELGKELAIKELEALSKEWESRLAVLQFDETKKAFASAAHESEFHLLTILEMILY